MFFFPFSDDNPTTNKPIVCYCIIALCIFVFLWQNSLPENLNGAAIYNFGVVPAALLGDQESFIPSFMTIFTSMFMHGGFMHLAGNMLYMWIFADNIEDELGPVKFIIFYILAGIAAALTQVYMNTESTIPMVGASGAIGGVLGAYIVNHPKAKVLVLIPLGFFSQKK